MTVDLGEMLPVLAAATVVVGGLAAALVAIRRWIRAVARPAQAAADQLRTSNGHTAGQLLESTSATVDVLRRMADANRTRIDALDARLDRHIIAGHRAE